MQSMQQPDCSTAEQRSKGFFAIVVIVPIAAVAFIALVTYLIFARFSKSKIKVNFTRTHP
jgi:hypothetical protein